MEAWLPFRISMELMAFSFDDFNPFFLNMASSKKCKSKKKTKMTNIGKTETAYCHVESFGYSEIGFLPKLAGYPNFKYAKFDNLRKQPGDGKYHVRSSNNVLIHVRLSQCNYGFPDLQ